MNQYAWPGVPDLIKVARHGYRTRNAVLSAADADRDNGVGVK